MIENIVSNNGFDYVDLGLPSGTIWSTCNIGALKPSEPGLYFQWGDTQGYTKEQVGRDKQFSWDDYKWGEFFPSTTKCATKGAKYTTPNAQLEPEDDAAHVCMGGSWHIPSPEQCQELIDNTTTRWTKEDNMYGRLFMSKRYPSKSIFIPIAGYAWDNSIKDTNEIFGCGYIWSSVLDDLYVSNGLCLEFNCSKVDIRFTGEDRCNGLNVRGVIG